MQAQISKARLNIGARVQYAIRTALSLLFLWLVPASASADGGCATRAAVLCVFHSQGDWLIDGARVTSGATIHSFAHVELYGRSNASPTKLRGALIELVYGTTSCAGATCGNQWACRGTDPCAAGATLPAATAPLTAVLVKIVNLAALAHPPENPELDLARGPSVLSLPDAVIRRNGAQFDLTPMLATASPGTYRLLAVRTDAPAEFFAGDVVIAAGARVLVPYPAARDGLYIVRLLSQNGVRVSDAAWFLAVSPPGDEPRRRTFIEAVDASASWTTTPEAVAVRRDFLRRVLSGLADPGWTGDH